MDRLNQPGARGGRGGGAEESRERRREEEGREGANREVWRRRLTAEASGGAARDQEVGGATAVTLQEGPGEEREAGEMGRG